MRLGELEFYILNDGLFRLDGGAMVGNPAHHAVDGRLTEIGDDLAASKVRPRGAGFCSDIDTTF